MSCAWLTSPADVGTGVLRYAAPALLLVGGVPGAGKTTLLTRAADGGWQMLNADAIRGEVQQRHGLPANGYFKEHVAQARQIFFSRLDEHLTHGRSVIVDATLLTERSRMELLDRIRPHPHSPHLILLDCPYQQAFESVRARSRSVPHTDLRRYCDQWQLTRRALRRTGRLEPGLVTVTVIARPAAERISRITLAG